MSYIIPFYVMDGTYVNRYVRKLPAKVQRIFDIHKKICTFDADLLILKQTIGYVVAHNKRTILKNSKKLTF